MSAEAILRVAVPAPVYGNFDYLPPLGISGGTPLKPGIRLLVPFGRGLKCGLLIEQIEESPLPVDRLKRIEKILDHEPLLGNGEIALLQRAADYYHYPLGEVLACALPATLRQGAVPRALVEPGWRLTAAAADGSGVDLRRAPRQAQVLALLGDSHRGLAQAKIYSECGPCLGVLKRLQQKGMIEPCELAEVFAGLSSSVAQGPRLSDEQQRAVDAVQAGLGGFGAYLLDGVTGSGKTEVYLRLLENLLAADRQILVLVPEIGLTPQLWRRFEARLGKTMVVMHSGLSDLERERAWQLARSGAAGIVLGTRSALFTPMPNLGLILVDEEHDLSLKQQEGFRYSARDLAVMRAQQVDCPVLLGSATPSLESLQNARAGRYRRLHLSSRAGGAAKPQMDLLDIRSVRLEAGISPALKRLIREQLQQGNQVLLFLNRRGYAPVVICHHCGWVAECQRCDARMTYHLGRQVLCCHHCGREVPVSQDCPACGSSELRQIGQGTERVERFLAQEFPDQGVVRIDRDATRRKGRLEHLLEEIREGKYSLLLGTQMLSKGHHFPNVTLVGVLDVDQGLFSVDYRAAERMAQQIIQVAGRAGRAGKPGRVLIQTRHPDHPLLQLLVHEGYSAFAEEALYERREAGLPPFSYQALLRAEAIDESRPINFLGEAAELLRTSTRNGCEIWGPVPAPMERRAGRFRAHLLLQSVNRTDLHRALKDWVPRLAALRSARRVRWSLDVDPQESY